MKTPFTAVIIFLFMFMTNFTYAETKMIKYKVKSGDSLYKIAHKNNTTITKIRKANGLKKGDLIRQGMVLKIPQNKNHVKSLHGLDISNLKKIKVDKPKKFTVDDIFFGGKNKPKQKKTKKQIALQDEYDCVVRNALELDDGRSDASTIARAVQFSCRNYSDKVMFVVMPKKAKKNKYSKMRYTKIFRESRSKFMREKALVIILKNRRYTQ